MRNCRTQGKRGDGQIQENRSSSQHDDMRFHFRKSRGGISASDQKPSFCVLAIPVMWPPVPFASDTTG
jgi:hypothetical protein